MYGYESKLIAARYKQITLVELANVNVTLLTLAASSHNSHNPETHLLFLNRLQRVRVCPLITSRYTCEICP